MVVYTRSQKDGRAFICKVAKKVLLMDLIQVMTCRYSQLSFSASVAVALPLGTCSALLTFMLSLAGLDGVATIPGCGRLLAKALLREFYFDVEACTPCASQEDSNTDVPSDSLDSEDSC